MQAFPHVYFASAEAALAGEVTLTGDSLPVLRSLPPREFDGPGNRWSPETLFVAAMADCYVLTFRAIAAVCRLRWTALTCEVEGTVGRVDRATQFTGFRLRARLEVPADSDPDEARLLLTRAKHACLISNSVRAPALLDADIVVNLAGAA